MEGVVGVTAAVLPVVFLVVVVVFVVGLVVVFFVVWAFTIPAINKNATIAIVYFFILNVF